jgi:hypothetical protein
MNKRNYIAVIVSAILVSLSALIVFFNLNNLLEAPIQSIPIDSGWLGFVFIFTNGFFLSFILDQNRLGILERLLLTIGLGFGITSAVMILLGLSWEFSLLTILLTQGTLLVILTVAALFQGFRVKLNAFSLPKKSDFRLNMPNVFDGLLIVVIGLLVFVALYDTLLLPSTDWDSLAYGVNYARIMFQTGNIPLIAGPSIGIEMSASYPPGVQLIGVFLYFFAGNANDFYYRILSPIFSIATLIVVYKFAMLINKNRKCSIYATSVLSIIPFFWEIFIAETYLMALTLMLTLSAFFFLKAIQSNSADAKKYEIIGTLFCGFAALTSYIGLFAFGILLLYGIIKKVEVKRIMLLVTLALVVIVPWYSRNLLLLGNPVFPFFGFGKYLDPLLKSSTAQHFQYYTRIPFYGWTSALSKVGTGILAVAIAYLTFSKRKNFLVTLPLYFLIICTLIMAFHVPFPRYIIIALPVLVVIFSKIIRSVPNAHNLSQITAVVLISLIVLSSAAMLPIINTVKPASLNGETQTQYLSRVFEEGDAWQWINENTPANATIATFDIKEYYLSRNILALDGNESAPIYQMDIQEAVKFLQDKGVDYVLSVPWASPMDNRMPPAYVWCPLTKYLGDPDYLPPLFVGKSGTTVYHVGTLEEDAIYQSFSPKGMVAPIKSSTVNLTITNSTYTYVSKCYLPIPVDYRTGIITVSVNSSKPINIELWNGTIPTDQIEHPVDNFAKNFMIAKSAVTDSSNSAMSLLQWHIDKAGYFTIRVIDKEENLDYAYNIALNITFRNFLEMKFS